MKNKKEETMDICPFCKRGRIIKKTEEVRTVPSLADRFWHGKKIQYRLNEVLRCENCAVTNHLLKGLENG